MVVSSKDKIAALDKLSDSELRLLGVKERPVYTSHLLRKLERLADGKRPPQTPAQKHFALACNNRCRPETPYELAFLSYRSALKKIFAENEKRLRRLDAEAGPQFKQIEKTRRKWSRDEALGSNHYDPAWD